MDAKRFLSEGGRYFSRGIRHNNSLTDLNLRLNRLSDEGGKMLMEGMTGNTSLISINLSSNSMGYESAYALSQIISATTCNLRNIDLTGNEFVENDIKLLKDALIQNTKILTFDLRLNDVPKDYEGIAEIAKLIRRNEMNQRTLTS